MSVGDRSLAIHVTGLVQGVNYRNFIRAEAMTLGVRGWVVNREDGSVDAAFHGPGAGLAKLIEFCRKGPPDARVDGLDVRSCDQGLTDQAPDGAYRF